MAASIKQIEIWILEALKDERERVQDSSKSRTEGVIFGEVMEKHNLKSTEIDVARMSLYKRLLIKIYNKQGQSPVPWITDDGLLYLEDHYSAMESECASQEREVALAKIKQEREVEHTLWCYWCLADWGERIGMVAFLFTVFMVGYLSASNHLVSRIVSLIRDVKP